MPRWRVHIRNRTGAGGLRGGVPRGAVLGCLSGGPCKVALAPLEAILRAPIFSPVAGMEVVSGPSVEETGSRTVTGAARPKWAVGRG